MGFREDVNMCARDTYSDHKIFINCHYGYNVIELINTKRKEMGREYKTLLIYHGDRNYKEIEESYAGSFITITDYYANRMVDKEFVIVDAYGDLITMKDGDIWLSDKLDELRDADFDSIIIMNVNCMVMSILNEIQLRFPTLPIICIGDSETYITDHKILQALNNTKYHQAEIYKMRGYNTDVLHYIKKLRTGAINRLERCTERDMNIVVTKDPNNFFNIEEVLQYDICVDTTGEHREYNNCVRADLGFEFMPNINEPIVNITPFIIKDSTGLDIAVDAYNIFKIKSVSTDGGILRLKVEFRDHILELPINTEYLETISEHEMPIDIIEHRNGIKIEYAYVIPPRVCINKSFTDVLIYFSNCESVYARKLLMTVLMSCMRSYRIKTDYEYYL